MNEQVLAWLREHAAEARAEVRRQCIENDTPIEARPAISEGALLAIMVLMEIASRKEVA